MKWRYLHVVYFGIIVWRLVNWSWNSVDTKVIYMCTAYFFFWSDFHWAQIAVVEQVFQVLPLNYVDWSFRSPCGLPLNYHVARFRSFWNSSSSKMEFVSLSKLWITTRNVLFLYSLVENSADCGIFLYFFLYWIIFTAVLQIPGVLNYTVKCNITSCIKSHWCFLECNKSLKMRLTLQSCMVYAVWVCERGVCMWAWTSMWALRICD